MRKIFFTIFFFNISLCMGQTQIMQIESLYEKFDISLSWYQNVILSEISSTNGPTQAKKVSNNNYRFNLSYMREFNKTFFWGADFKISTESFKNQEEVEFINTKLRPMSAGLKMGIVKHDFFFIANLFYNEELIIQRVSLSQVELIEEPMINLGISTEFKLMNRQKYDVFSGIDLSRSIIKGFENDYTQNYDLTFKIGVKSKKTRHRSLYIDFFGRKKDLSTSSTTQKSTAIGINLGATWW